MRNNILYKCFNPIENLNSRLKFYINLTILVRTSVMHFLVQLK
jgi:hypothetical protein